VVCEEVGDRDRREEGKFGDGSLGGSINMDGLLFGVVKIDLVVELTFMNIHFISFHSL
jgi:hypothetical protein